MDKRILSLAMGALLGAGAASTPVLAQDGGQARPGGAMPGGAAVGSAGDGRIGSSLGALGEQYATIDKNSDGKISRSEAIEAGIDTDGWNEVDADNDGHLDEAEFAEFSNLKRPGEVGDPALREDGSAAEGTQRPGDPARGQPGTPGGNPSP